ncbi:MAG TPA: hypothetical protein VIV12_28600 [Streptosporangiaceae bacterium]
MSGAVIAEILPVLLLGPLAGVVADRLPRVGVMVAADLWRTALAGVLPLAVHHLAAVFPVACAMPSRTVRVSHSSNSRKAAPGAQAGTCNRFSLPRPVGASEQGRAGGSGWGVLCLIWAITPSASAPGRR